MDESLLYAIASRNNGYLVNAGLRTGPTLAELVRAAIASFGPHAVVGPQSAAELHGIGGAPISPLVHVIIPRQLGRGRRILDRAIASHQMDLDDADVTVADGIPVTTAGRTLMDLACGLDRFGAVAVADSCLNRGFVTDDELTTLAMRLRGRRGAIVARQAFEEADTRAESPLEARVRLRAADAKVKPDQLQYCNMSYAEATAQSSPDATSPGPVVASSARPMASVRTRRRRSSSMIESGRMRCWRWVSRW